MTDLLGGVHIVGVVAVLKEDADIVRLEVQVYPLPMSAVSGLADRLTKEAIKFLSEAGITNGDPIDITPRGPMN